MHKQDRNLIAAMLLLVIVTSCVINDPCAERNQPLSKREAALCN